MSDITIALDRDSPLSLQAQLRQHVVDAITTGVLQRGDRMPSSRSLADRVGVSRNTVVLAYADLVADGYLETRDRSGFYVARGAADGRIIGRRTPPDDDSAVVLRMQDIVADTGVRCPPHWQEYPWPFWDGRIDMELLPLQEWRKAVRLALTPREASRWIDGAGELDDPMLIEELRTKVLPERGINAVAEEILITRSRREALRFAVAVLHRPGQEVWLEEPLDAELMSILRSDGVTVPRRIDAGFAEPIAAGALLVVSARSGVSSGRRLDRSRIKAVMAAGGIVIEIGLPPDTLEPGAVQPALFAQMGAGHTVHVGSLSPAACPGGPLAFVVAQPAVIHRLRKLRRARGAFPSPLQQRAFAYFLSQGHYAVALRKAREILTRRKTALRDALNHYLHASVSIQSVPGVSAYWVEHPGTRGAQGLAGEAMRAGVLIQPGRLEGAHSGFLMGVTSISEGRIRDGVRALARVLRGTRGVPSGAPHAPRMLSEAVLRRRLAGHVLLYNTVYGEPCTIEVCRSGRLIGTAGYAEDDLDSGRWWIEGGRWWRQWDHWAYAEAEGFFTAIEGDRVYWYDGEQALVDQAVILPRKRAPARAGS